MGMGPDKDGSARVADEDRVDGVGDAAHAFTLRVLGWNSSFGPQSIAELDDCISQLFRSPSTSLDIALAGRAQYDGLAGGVIMPKRLLDGADGLRAWLSICLERTPSIESIGDAYFPWL